MKFEVQVQPKSLFATQAIVKFLASTVITLLLLWQDRMLLPQEAGPANVVVNELVDGVQDALREAVSEAAAAQAGPANVVVNELEEGVQDPLLEVLARRCNRFWCNVSSDIVDFYWL